nr:hypothetical protein [Haemophilus parahaemolyticus]
MDDLVNIGGEVITVDEIDCPRSVGIESAVKNF